MGSFYGHIVAGCCFSLLSMWWYAQTLYRFFAAKKRKTHFRSSVTWPVAIGGATGNSGQEVDIEAYIFLILSCFGVVVELIINPLISHHSHLSRVLQHSTLYANFVIAALVFIAISKRSRTCPNARAITYIALCVAFIVEGTLFRFHRADHHAIMKMDMKMHSFQGYALCACVIVILLEMHNAENVMYPILRAFFVGLQGTWFLQIAFTAFAPWRHEAHDFGYDVIALMFTWHLSALWICFLIVFYGFERYFKRSHEFSNGFSVEANYERLSEQLSEPVLST